MYLLLFTCDPSHIGNARMLSAKTVAKTRWTCYKIEENARNGMCWLLRTSDYVILTSHIKYRLLKIETKHANNNKTSRSMSKVHRVGAHSRMWRQTDRQACRQRANERERIRKINVVYSDDQIKVDQYEHVMTQCCRLMEL